RLDKPAVDEILGRLGHGETARAEELNLEQITELVEALRQAELANEST
ncbi:MAG: ribosomal RNA small subunit methyltransferase A, partial [Rhodopirellula bahusiensis]